MLIRAVGIDQEGCHSGGSGPVFQRRDEGGDGVVLEIGVRVDEKQDLVGDRLGAGVRGAGEGSVLIQGQHFDLGEGGGQALGAAVTRARIDQDDPMELATGLREE